MFLSINLGQFQNVFANTTSACIRHLNGGVFRLQQQSLFSFAALSLDVSSPAPTSFLPRATALLRPRDQLSPVPSVVASAPSTSPRYVAAHLNTAPSPSAPPFWFCPISRPTHPLSMPDEYSFMSSLPCVATKEKARQGKANAPHTSPLRNFRHVKSPPPLPPLSSQQIRNLAPDITSPPINRAYSYHLSLPHPEIQKKLRDELDIVLGPDVQVTEPDTHKLPYLQVVIKETLRL